MMALTDNEKPLRRLITLSLLLTVSGYAWGLTSDREQQAIIQADSVEYNNKTGLASYTGHVDAKQGTTHITADKVLLYRDNHKDISKVVAFGSPALYSTLPDGSKDRLDAKANKIEFHPITGIVTLIGQGFTQLGANTFSSDHINYDINQQVVVSNPTNQGRTTIVLEPRQQGKLLR